MAVHTLEIYSIRNFISLSIYAHDLWNELIIGMSTYTHTYKYDHRRDLEK